MLEKAKVFILGTFHFAECGEHMMNLNAGDITSAKRQLEIKEVVQKLIEFGPNKIAVESRKEKEQELNDLFKDFCKSGYVEDNRLVSNSNEIVQLGFRTAHILKHERIYALDYPVNLPEQVFKYAEEQNRNFLDEFMNEVKLYSQKESEVFQDNTVGGILRHLNDPKRYTREHSNLYLRLAQVGAGDTYDGGDMLTEWYRRNLYIFGNLQKAAEPGDRILVIYGAGHCKILQDFARDYDEFQLVDPLSYI